VSGVGGADAGGVLGAMTGRGFMVRAYIFITARKAEEREVADTIVEFPTVRAAHVITGDIDVIAFVEAQDLSAVWETVSRVQAIPGVTRTTTSLVVEPS
jgi:DNA-binding Lrp family transcriptional regulator